MTREETSAFVVWLMLVIVLVVVLDGGLIAGIVMALAGTLMGFLAVRRRRAAGRA